VFAVRVSPGGPTAAPDETPASDNAPAIPNTVKAFVRPLRFEFHRFEFRLPCDMVEASDFTPALICNYTTTTAGNARPGAQFANSLPMLSRKRFASSANLNAAAKNADREQDRQQDLADDRQQDLVDDDREQDAEQDLTDDEDFASGDGFSDDGYDA
jgi:hypothetical protein